MSKGGPERAGYFRAVAFGVFAFIGAYAAAESIVKEVNNTPRDSAPFWCPGNVRIAYTPKDIDFDESVQRMAVMGIKDFDVYLEDNQASTFYSALELIEGLSKRYDELSFKIGGDFRNLINGQVINCRRAVIYRLIPDSRALQKTLYL